jgi:hypothetical protein
MGVENLPLSLKSSAAALLALGSLMGGGLAAANAADTMPAHPRFMHPPALNPEARLPTATIPLWTFKFSHKKVKYHDEFVGNPPTGAAVTIPSYVIPLKIVLSNGEVYTTTTVQSNGQTALANTVNSPVFQSTVDFKEAGADLGKTQYIDAFQRESFWPTVLTNPGYHVLLGAPTVLPEYTLNVPKADGTSGTEFGAKVALVSYSWLSGQLPAIIASYSQIAPNGLAVIASYNTYETSGGCCIGGWHGANGSQTFTYFSYVCTAGAFSQDVSALTHEVGEWLDDPYIENQTSSSTPCGYWENGDPLENTPNYGSTQYVVGGTTYNLQDLAQPPYFGAPKSTTLNGRATFQGVNLSVCQNGG